MTRKDYKAIAAAFVRAGARTLRGPEDETWQILRHEIGEALGSDNPRFDPQRFYAACEAEPTE